MKVRRPVVALAVSVAVAAMLAASTSAAPTPGTPLAVAPGVPDQGRAWELVTLPDPVSGLVYGINAVAEDGNRVSYISLGPLPDSPSAEPALPPAIAVRGANGWTNSTIPTPHPELVANFSVPVAFDPNLTTVLQPNELPEYGEALYRGTPGDGNYELLVEQGEVGMAVGASTDLQHVVFASADHLLPGDAGRTGGRSLYEVAGRTLRLVDVDDQGGLISDCGTQPLFGSIYPTLAEDSVSRDGNKIFFLSSPSCGPSTRVYLRTGGSKTTEISASQCDLSDCGPEQNVSFAGATPSGSVAFMVTTQRLTDDDTNSHADLYRYGVATGDLSLIPTGPPGGEPIPLAEAVHCSEDGSRVYFSAVEGASETGGLYLADGSGSHLVPGAGPTGFLEVSADGRYAIYASRAQLVPADTDESVDVYRYDAASHSVALVSAGSSGGNEAFDASIALTSFVNAAGALSPRYRAASGDGGRIFFSTLEQLLPADNNDVRDVYEWANGSVGLISSGTGSLESNFLGSSRDGSTAFFETVDTLVPQDRDGGEIDIYAARVGGGFPEAAPDAGCQGPCSAVPRPALVRAAPASAKLGGGGIRVLPLGAAARRRIAATGWIAISTEVPTPGRLSARASARIGKRVRTIASTAAAVKQAGPARLRMRLSDEARRSLASGHGLDVSLRLRLSHLPTGRRLGFQLRGAR
jgi:hypothetical protein